jgi:hypothetical protein
MKNRRAAMKNNKAIGQVVGMILTALITISLAGLAFVWATGYFQKTARTAEGSTGMIKSWNMMPQVEMISEDAERNILFYAKNGGSETIPNNTLGIYINSQLMPNVTHAEIMPFSQPILVNTTYKCTENMTVLMIVTAGSNTFQANFAC